MTQLSCFHTKRGSVTDMPGIVSSLLSSDKNTADRETEVLSVPRVGIICLSCMEEFLLSSDDNMKIDGIEL